MSAFKCTTLVGAIAIAALSCGLAGCGTSADTPSTADAADTPDAGSSDGPGEGAAGPWGCVGSVEWPRENPATLVKHSVRFVVQGTTTPIPGLTVKGCPQLDLECGTPYATTTTDAEGVMNLMLPQYFRGYLGIYPPTTDTYVTNRFYLYPPKAADMETLTANIASVTQMRLIAGSLGVDIDLSRFGFGSAAVVDCQGKRTADISIAISNLSSDPSYPTAIGYLSATGLIGSTPAYTSSLGGAGFANVPPGLNTLTMTNVKTGVRTGVLNVLFRAGEMTLVYIPPTP